VDRQLIETAYSEDRILITEDKDFGWLAFVGKMNNPGVILIRFPAHARPSLQASVVELVDKLGEKLVGSFVVLRPGSARISKTTTPE
jgi:predicted nuclease of predicted toxin-antitoxin system